MDKIIEKLDTPLSVLDSILDRLSYEEGTNLINLYIEMNTRRGE